MKGSKNKTIVERLHDLQGKLIESLAAALDCDEIPPGIYKEVRELLKDNQITGDFQGKDKGKLDILSRDIEEISKSQFTTLTKVGNG